jgi:hypothetical protein
MKPSSSRTSLHILILLSLLLSLLGGALSATPAQADAHTVSDCNAPGGNANRLVDTLDAAASGDIVNFSCSGTITLPYRIYLSKDLTIDGSGQTVTISGGDTVGVMLVNIGYSLTLNNLTIANGHAINNPGGGIFNNGGTVTITNSTFSDNRSTGNNSAGGAFYNNGGTLSIANSTFSANSTDSIVGGGAIYQRSGTVTIINSTFFGNSATGADANGGGVKNGGGGTLTLINTILSQNLPGGNCGGGIINGGNNIEDGTICDWGSGSGSMSDTDPLLGTLTGSPAYFPLLPGSPAIDAGNDSVCAAAPVNNTSQNGLTRPKGFHCDIGSYERLIILHNVYLPLVRR